MAKKSHQLHTRFNNLTSVHPPRGDASKDLNSSPYKIQFEQPLSPAAVEKTYTTNTGPKTYGFSREEPFHIQQQISWIGSEVTMIIVSSQEAFPILLMNGLFLSFYSLTYHPRHLSMRLYWRSIPLRTTKNMEELKMASTRVNE
ncbi:hypothetical protein NPIL_176131 [Nephila pilipes]|uniref:Uncharacterized protein n=1 Tax=Nephila pilipes TaxID=299642 RepID=A0A8X6N500_NEPPI|nr:hypothetical protein NPIL_176131 [Nephila pilipes]